MLKKVFKDCVMYEIYPSSFCDSNNDGIGDINGIISKLDYVKSLGVDGIWFNPMYDSPFLDGGYDVRDFFKVSDRYGTMEDLQRLIDEVHKRDMLVLFDLVPGHVSVYNKDFLQSAEASKNEMSDTFIWTDDPWCYYTDCTPIRGIFNRNGAYIVNFFAHQPAINYGYNEITHPSWQIPVTDNRARQGEIYLEKIMRFYLDMNIDGFRVDMADSLVKNDGTTKVETIKLWQRLLTKLRKDYDFILTSEWANPTCSLKAGFDSDFVLHHHDNFHHYLLRKRDESNTNTLALLHTFDKQNYDLFVESVNSHIEASKKYHKSLSFISGNHDTERLANFLSEEELRLAYLFLYTFNGVPYLYYGDEIGMKQDRSLPSKEGGFQRTGARSPMRFDNSLNNGFSTVKDENLLYLPSNKESSTVEDMAKDPTSLFNLIKNLIKLRHTEDGLRDDDVFEFIDNYYFAFRRGDNIEVYINVKEDEDMVINNIESEDSILFKVNRVDFDSKNKKVTVSPHGGVVIKRK